MVAHVVSPFDLSRTLPVGGPWTVVHQVTLSIVFSRQEYWRGLPFPSPVDLPNPGVRGSTLIETAQPGQAP